MEGAMTTKEILAQRLSQLREEAKIPRQKAADDLGVTRAALEFYEKGKRTPDVGMIARLAQYYGVSTDYLLGMDTKDSSARDWFTMRFMQLC